ncbi:MAG: arginine--tRNA ligase [Deltaproteobacteria bacterium]|nr:arginine--tRNA ligase [Deltaproteobacteria bacterium]
MAYALETAQSQIQSLLEKACSSSSFEMKNPPPKVDADLAVPLFRMAKESGKNPAAYAAEIAAGLELEGTLFESVSVTGGFVNFKLAESPFTERVFADFAENGEEYGGSQVGAGRNIVIDFSSPNIAKPFSVGHLRSTIIGDSLYKILSFVGYRVIGDNHIGDWGTQFGKLLYAFDVWGDRQQVEANPIREMLALYVRFHQEAEKDPALEQSARGWFKRLEEGDPEANELWQWARDASWEEFQRIYLRLGVKFDEVLGESFYNDHLDVVVKNAFDQGLAQWGEIEALPTEGQGEDEAGDGEDSKDVAQEKVALIHLDDHGIETPLLIQKSDGTSLYATRDLATIDHREKTWKPAEILYVVGGEQKLYFRQLFKAAELLGSKAKCVHVPFGLIRLPAGKMSTRKGNVIFLEDVLEEAVSRSEAILEERDLSDQEKRQIAEVVGIGAVKFADLSQTRTKDVLFDWEKMLNMQGDSAPYLQYAYVRIQSILRKASESVLVAPVDPSLLTEAQEMALIKALARFPETVGNAARSYYPHLIATYLVSLAREFSSFYKAVPILKTEPASLAATRLELARRTAQVLQQGLGLLGIACPQRM